MAVLLPAPVAVTVIVGELSESPVVVPLVDALTCPVEVDFNVHLPLAVIA